MSDGARKEVADSTDSAAYFGPMSEAKQNHEAMLQLTETWPRDRVIAIGSRRLSKRGSIHPHYYAAVTAGEFWGWLPELWAYEMARAETLYWIFQPMKPHLRREPPTAANGFRPSYYEASDENVADFAAIPLDLDVGRPGRPTAGEAIEVILAESLAGTIPTPTYLAYSGRGTYAIWQLRQTVPNTPTNRSRWRAILLRLIARTRSLELSPDPIASNPARWYKVPNTVDTNTNNRVAYLPISIDHGPVARYTFDELEAALGMLVLPSIPATEQADAPLVRREHRTEHHERQDKRDGSYVHSLRAHEIVLLSNARGGMREGVRKMTLFYYFGAVRAAYACKHPKSGEAHSWARLRAHELNATFRPPLPAAELENAIERSAENKVRRRWRAETIARALDVSPAEAEALGLHAIAPADTREGKATQARKQVQTRQEARSQRAEDIRALIAQHPKWSDLDVARALGGVSRQLVAYYRDEIKAEDRQGTLPIYRSDQDAKL